MKRSRFTEKKITAILREQKAAAADMGRMRGVRSPTVYKRKAK